MSPDPRIQKFASTLINFCLEIQPGMSQAEIQVDGDLFYQNGRPILWESA